MAREKEIRCGLCDCAFEVFPREEKHYCDYDEYTETRYYPTNAHLVRGYLCDNCYNDMTNIVRNKFIANGLEQMANLQARKAIEYQKYMERLEELDKENKMIEFAVKKISNHTLLIDLDINTIKYLKDGFPYTTGASYYLDSALEKEKNVYKAK